jgi:hypothetical protein
MNRKTLAVSTLLGTGFAVSLAPVAQADSHNPFAAADAAYTVVAEHHEHEGGEGACGTKEGKDKKAEEKGE